jgi:hypothetical protein
MFTAKVKMDGVIICQSKEHETKKGAACEALDILSLTNLPMMYVDPLVVEIFFRDDRYGIVLKDVIKGSHN